MELCDVNTGDRVRIKRLNTDASIRRRLLDIGLIPGTEVECVAIGPQGDPLAFCVRGAVIAIRKRDCKNISVEHGR